MSRCGERVNEAQQDLIASRLTSSDSYDAKSSHNSLDSITMAKSCPPATPSKNNRLKRCSSLILLMLLLMTFCQIGSARIHRLVLKHDIRRYFGVSTFGFFTDGKLIVNLEEFSFLPHNDDSVFGFTLARTISDSLIPYLEGHQEKCLLLNDDALADDNIGLTTMKFDLKNNVVIFNCSPNMRLLSFSQPKQSGNGNSEEASKNLIELGKNRRKRESFPVDEQDHAKSLAGESKQKNKDDSPNQSQNLGDQSAAAASNASHLINSEQQSRKEIDDKPPRSDSLGSPNQPLAKQNEPESGQNNAQDNKPKIEDTVETNMQPNGPRIENDSDKMDDNEEAKHIGAQDDDREESGRLNEITSADAKENEGTCLSVPQPLPLHVKKDPSGRTIYSFEFMMIVTEQNQQGLYSLFFHSCPNYGVHGGMRKATAMNMTLNIEENNIDNYLSAGEIPLPQLYVALSIIFFLLGAVWFQVIGNKKEDAFKIHYLMGALVLVKALSLLFHGINYHFIATMGHPEEAWAIMYYSIHLLKGALLFMTIILIGTGWAFVKHVLSKKEKKLFMVVIPLQVFANIADILVEESVEGEMAHSFWREMFILIDLLCCGAILFPVVWSIRHLKEASTTDGKAAINLKKLRLFRRFYVMIVCYIYFTRIIVYLVRIIVPFQYEWLDVFFQHAATLIFFIFTGYHFQPTPTNPYFALSSEDDLELEEVLFSANSLTSGLTKKNRGKDTLEIDVSSDKEDDDRQMLVTRREASHEYD